MMDLSSIDEGVLGRLTQFVLTFVKEFEQKLKHYEDELQGKEQKGAKSACSSEVVGAGLGMVAGSYLLQQPSTGASVGSKAFSVLAKYVGELVHKGKAANITKVRHSFGVGDDENNIAFRKILIDAGVDIFRSFEKQFMTITAEGVWKIGITLLAVDAMERIMNYLDNSVSDKHDYVGTQITGSIITKWFLQGKSKGYLGTKVPYSKIQYGKKECKISRLFEGCGIIVPQINQANPPSHYKKKDGTSNTIKYGYRLPFTWEKDSLNRFSKNYVKDGNYGVHSENLYRYTLTTQDIIEVSKELLDKLHKDDPRLMLIKIDERVTSGNTVQFEMKEDVREIKRNLGQLLSKQQPIRQEPIWFEVPQSVISFTGRADVLKEINDNVQSAIVVITGLGGVGKSQLAVRHAETQFGRKAVQSVIWINAEKGSSCKTSFGRLLKKVGISSIDIDGDSKSTEMMAQDAYDYFRCKTCLFVFDNAETYSSIRKVLPISLPSNELKHYILITSQNTIDWKSTSAKIKRIHLGDFTDEEAVEFVSVSLTGCMNTEEFAEQAKELRITLANFPLALGHAVTYINEMNEEYQLRGRVFGMNDYLTEFRKTPQLFYSSQFQGDSRVKTISKTLEVALSKIRKVDNRAIEMLNVMLYLSGKSIPEEIFLNKFANGDQRTLHFLIGLLRKYALVSMEKGFVNLHEMVQQVLRYPFESVPNKGVEICQEEETLRTAIRILKRYIKSVPSNTLYCIQHIIAIWHFASKYDTLVSNYIINKSNFTTFTTNFHLIVEGSSYKVIETVIKRIEHHHHDKLDLIINQVCSKDDGTPLHRAVARGDVEIVNLLLQKGANVLAEKKHGWSALHLATKNGLAEIAKELLKCKANVNAKTNFSFTPLHLASKYSHFELVKILVDNGADVECQTNQKFTPLHFSAQNGDIDVMNVLLQNGAQTAAKTEQMFTALHLASKHGHFHAVEVLLLASSSIIAEVDRNGFTALHWGAYNGHIEVVEKLIRKMDLDMVNLKTIGKNNTALDLATEKNYQNVVQIITKYLSDGSKNKGQGATKTFEKTVGSAGIEGQLYEINMSMMLLLQGLSSKEQGSIQGFHLAANMKKGDKFDDVVFKYKYNQDGVCKSKLIFIQAKHKTDPKKNRISANSLLKDSGDFSLLVYLNAYLSIENVFLHGNIDDPIFDGDFQDSEFVIYTSALPDFSNYEENFEHIEVDEADMLCFEKPCHYYKIKVNGHIESKIIEFLKYASPCKMLAKVLAKSIFPKGHNKAELPGQGIVKEYCIPLAEKVIEIDNKNSKLGRIRDSFLLGSGQDIDSNDLIFRNEFFEEVQKLKGFSKKELKTTLERTIIKLPESFSKLSRINTTLPSDFVSTNTIVQFLSQLKLFVKQPTETRLEDIIKQRIRQVYKVPEQDCSRTFAEIRTKVQDWWKAEVGWNDYLTETNRFFLDSVRISIRFNVMEPVKFFTGRERELDELHSLLQGQGRVAISPNGKITSVTGLGGIGKTELTRKYISIYSHYYDDNFVWINAATGATLVESFRRLAETRLGINTKYADGREIPIKYIVEQVYNYFAKRRALFVFDNAEMYKSLCSGDGGIDVFLPASSHKIYIIITSRLKEWGPNICSLEVNVFSPDEAAMFIRKALGLGNCEQTEEVELLGQKLHYFPLALQQAVAYSREHSEDAKKWGRFAEPILPLRQYLGDFDAKALELLAVPLVSESNEASVTDYDIYTKTVLTTWTITISKIKHLTRGGIEALKILEIISYFAPEKILVDDLLSDYVQDNGLLHSAVVMLDQYSMVSLYQGELSVHRLVQQVTRLNLGKGETKVLEKAMNIVREVIQRTNGKASMDHIPHGISAWNHVSNCKELVTKFVEVPSEIILSLGTAIRYEEACIFGLEALEVLVNCIGSDNLKVLTTKDNVGEMLNKQGKYDQALKFFRDVVDGKSKIQGGISQGCLNAMNNMAVVLENMGKYSEAQLVYDEILNKQKSTEGIDRNEFLIMLYNNGTMLFNLGKYKEALATYDKVHKKRIEMFGPDHLETLVARNGIAKILTNLGEYDRAKDIFEAILDLRGNNLGPDHPDTINCQSDLAEVISRQGRHSYSLSILQDVLSKSEKTLGPDHIDTLTVRTKLAHELDHLGEHEQALKLQLTVLNKRRELLGADHQDCLTTENRIGKIYCNQGKYNESFKILENVLNRRSVISGSDHPSTLTALDECAMLMVFQGKYEEGYQQFLESLNKRELSLGSDHPDTLITKNNIAFTLFKQGKYQAALEYYEQVLEIRTSKFGPDDPSTLLTKRDLAKVHVAIETGCSPLHFLNSRPELRQAKYLLEHGLADFNVKNKNGSTPLHEVSSISSYSSDSVVVVKLMLDNGANVNAVDDDNYTPLHFASQNGCKNIAEILIRYGAKINAKDSSSWTPLHLAAQNGYFEVAKLLLEADASEINGKTATGIVALHLAVLKGHYQIVEALLGKGADVNVTDNDGWTSLHRAVQCGQDEIVRILINNNANVNAVGKLNFTPLHMAVDKGFLQSTNMLLEKGAHVEDRSESGDTALSLAVQSGKYDIAAILLSKGAQVTARCTLNCTVLHRAVYSRNEMLIRLILDEISKIPNSLEYINAKDKEGDTPLMWAAENGSVNATKVLLEYPVNITAKNNSGKTALDWAKEGGFIEITDLLLAKFSETKPDISQT